MRRGNQVKVALQGDPSKPRPVLIIQSDLSDAHPSLATLPVNVELRYAPLFRIPVNSTERNGLTQPSQVIVDIPQSVARKIDIFILTTTRTLCLR